MPAPRLQTHASPTPSAPDVVDTAATRSDVVEPLNLTPLLKAYDEALKLARHPPASLRLPRRLEAAHRALRLAVGCEYFATRTVRRRLDTLERALTVRAAIGEAADGDAATLDALRSFRGSLAPAPSRAWKVAGAIAVVVVAQAALGDEFAASTGAASLRDALRGLGLSPDVRSTGDLVTALTSGNLRMFEALTSAVLAIPLLFGLPLGGGYRLAQMCLGQPGHAGSWRRTSPLCRRAAQLQTAQREAQAARSLGAELRREVPLDLFVKAALCAAVAFWLLDLARTTAPPQEYEGGALPAKSMLLVLVLSVLAVVPLAGRLTWRGRLISARTSLTANVVLVLITCGLALRLALARGLGLSDVGTWVAIALALLLGLAWLSSRAIGRHQGSRWIVVPVAATLAAGMLASTDDALVPPDFRAHAITRTDAIEDAGLDAVPRLSRGDLQMLLLSRTRLADADLRTQDMHLLSLRERDLAGAQLRLADLTQADLRRADLRAADLSAARAAGATLRGANLAGANLRCADLRGADLRGATLTGALLDATIVNDATRLPRGLGSRQRSKLRHRSGSTRIPDGRSFYDSLWTCHGLPSARRTASAAAVAPAVPTRFLSSRPVPRTSDRIHP